MSESAVAEARRSETPGATGAGPAAGAAGAPLLALLNVEVLYAEVILALKGVSLQVAQGGCVALLGANGAGKSTTLKAISGVIESDDGRVSGGSIAFEGRPIHGHDTASVVRGGLVHVMEGRRVLPHMTVEQNLIIGGHMFGSTAQMLHRAGLAASCCLGTSGPTARWTRSDSSFGTCAFRAARDHVGRVVWLLEFTGACG